MSVTALKTPASRAFAPGLRVTLPRVVQSEWIKLTTLRSTWYTLAAAIVAMVGIGFALGSIASSRWATLHADDIAVSGQLRGALLAELLIGVLGVLFVSGEYGTGMIHSTFAAVPRRLPVLGAKAAVFGAVALVTMIVASFGAFFGAQALLAAHNHTTSLSAPGVIRVVVGTGVYLALIGLLGVALGWIVRSTAGGIVALVTLLLILPTIFAALSSRWATTVAEYLPTKAGGSFITSIHTSGTLAPGTGIAVLGLWVAAALTVAAVLVRRRDA